MLHQVKSRDTAVCRTEGRITLVLVGEKEQVATPDKLQAVSNFQAARALASSLLESLVLMYHL